MINIRKEIVITVLLNNEYLVLTTYEGEYRSLMMLLYDRLFLEDFGECKGIGRCGTCHIQLINPPDYLLTMEGNEKNTLSKHNIDGDYSRLACQILIDDRIDGLIIKIDFK